MSLASRQLDRRLGSMAPLTTDAKRPAGGWVRAIREALGMTTAQLARRMGVSQPRVSEFERAEASGNVTLRSLERAAEALGCRFVYVLLPTTPLTERIDQRAEKLALEQIAQVEQTMMLEDQFVYGSEHRDMLKRLVDALMARPARLWSDDERDAAAG